MARASRQDLGETLAAKLLGEIRELRLAAGTHLRAQDLATRLGVSRFPVGQALQLLAGKGAASPRDMVDMLRPAIARAISKVNDGEKGIWVETRRASAASAPPLTR